MDRFLQQCAKYIFKKHKNQLSDICLVFPNRRAGVFFRAYLQQQISTSVIGPNITTINELFAGFSNYKQAEKLYLISMLYDVFVKHTHSTEPFDEFYYWGEILLADFNDIDRYLVDAKDLFTNVYDVKEIESVFDYLSDEQKQALKHFWGSVVAGRENDFEKKYLNIWGKLYLVYADFKTLLHDKNLSYGGMSDRSVIEALKNGTIKFNYSKYYFIGLNAINNCEKALFDYLKRNSLGTFLWDFGATYMQNSKNEAGFFLRKNIKQFPAPDDFLLKDNGWQKKNIKLVAVSSINGQTQQLPFFINEVNRQGTENFDTTAVVLANESLLYPALGAIPNNIEKINITMGYPVKNSVIYGFLLLLVNLMKNTKFKKGKREVYHRFVTDVLNHQILSGIESEKNKNFFNTIKKENKITIQLDEIDFSQLHKTIFNVPEKVAGFSNYFLNVIGNLFRLVKESNPNDKILLELIYTIHQSVEKLKQVVEQVKAESGREINEQIYFRLFKQFIGQESVAFEGEPLSGLQIMGILETRCLDFENLVILGLNENKWPRTYTAPSFIPYNIRKGFGLPGIDEQDAMYAYYFYRLIERAKNITATYSVVKEGISTGELSRYGFQLMYNRGYNVQLENLNFKFANDPIHPIEIISTKQHVEYLLKRNNEKPLSPSAINTYIACSLKFYFKYLAKINEPDEVKEEIDGMIFGNVFHKVFENLYSPFVGKVMNEDDFKNFSKNKYKTVIDEIEKQVSNEYFKQKKGQKGNQKLQGKSLLIFENLKTFIFRLLKLDMELAPFTLLGLEKKLETSLTIKTNNRDFVINVGGVIDRVDQVNSEVRVVDYKTGAVKSKSFKELEELFESTKDHKKEILQTLVYALLYAENDGDSNVVPAIYSIGDFFKESFAPHVKHDKSDINFSNIEKPFREALQQLISEMFSEGNVFKQTDITENCKWCSYASICQRD